MIQIQLMSRYIFSLSLLDRWYIVSFAVFLAPMCGMFSPMLAFTKRSKSSV